MRRTKKKPEIPAFKKVYQALLLTLQHGLHLEISRLNISAKS